MEMKCMRCVHLCFEDNEMTIVNAMHIVKRLMPG